ncbi:hypothetical protein [Paraclostridium bifermentans]|uniref:hypothetical protein n=1 Tax=Paraclostridium bifermentans TaxID=1490 RepID=UPI0034E041EA
MSEKIIIDGKEYEKLDIVKIKVDDEEKEKNQITAEDTNGKESIQIKIVVDDKK